MIVIFSGLPGSGKSYKLGRTVVDILYRNRKDYERAAAEYANDPSAFVLPGHLVPTPPRKRMVWTNLKLSAAVEQEFEGYIQPWTELRQLTLLRDCDVVMDEVGTYFDSRLWETLSFEMRRWLAQHRKLGIEIYGTAQDFAQCDKAFRRLTSDLLYLTKVVGSRDISATKPPPRFIWGIVLVRHLDPVGYDEEKSKFQSAGLPSLMFITRAGTSIFDTRAEVKTSQALPMHHIERVCELSSCTFHKVSHV